MIKIKKKEIDKNGKRKNIKKANLEGIITRHNPFVSSKTATSGITLVALVVTIVVLLILAGITINMLMGDNGIIKKAQEAKEATIRSNTISDIQTEILIEQMDEDITQAKLEEILNKYGDIEREDPDDPTSKITGIKVEGLQEVIPIEEIYNEIVGGTPPETPPGPSTIPLTGITLDKTTAELVATTGDTLQLTAIIKPDNAINKAVTWSSSAEGVATVSNSGLVTAVSEGTATITVTTNDGSKTASCSVTVRNWDLSKVNKVIVDGQNIPVPKGYSLSKATGEKSVATGLVLYEGETEVNNSNVATAQTSRNQFVWVPVPETELNNMVEKYDATNYRGKLYDFGTSISPKNPPEVIGYSPNSGNREPAIICGGYDGTGSSCDADASYINDVLEDKYKDTTGTKKIQEQFKAQLQAEFNSMVESVKLYKGFYIGRYETGGLSSTPVVKKGNSDINNQTWYTMYNESKNIKGTKTNVTSSMIWGCQWDATLRWFLTSSNADVRKFVTDSTGKGYHGQSSSTTTGFNPAYAVNNIYDMSGNVYDLTLEAFDIGVRECRRRLLLLFRL